MTTIVRFEDRHADGVVALCAAEGWSSWTGGTVTSAFTAPGVLALVAEDGERVVGAAQLLSDGTAIAYLGVLVVAADMRGNGVGHDLVEELFLRSGMVRMDLLSEPDSTGFYESLPHKRKPGYRLYQKRP